MTDRLKPQWNRPDPMLSYAQRVRDVMEGYVRQGTDSFGKKFHLVSLNDTDKQEITLTLYHLKAGKTPIDLSGEDAIRVDVSKVSHHHKFTVEKVSSGETVDPIACVYDFNQVLTRIDNFAERVSPHLARQVKTSRDYSP